MIKAVSSIPFPAPLAIRTRSLVNYVWINEDKYEPGENDPPCGVPLHYIDRALDNAGRYPNADFKIWLDASLLVGTASLDMIYAHLETRGLDNVELCDLGDIPVYSNRMTRVFNPLSLWDRMSEKQQREFKRCGNVRNIWARVDFARLVVLRHSLLNGDADDIFYSDFDTTDVSLEALDLVDCLGKFGMVFGRTQLGYTENSFIGFRRSAIDWDLFNQILHETHAKARIGGNGYAALCRLLADWRGAQETRVSARKLTVPIVERMGYKLPKPSEYEGLCI